MTGLIAFLVGILFGSGLLLSGMTNPANVIAFLDITGDWRPTLIFTMAAAVAVALPAYAVVRARGVSVRGRAIPSADRNRIDWPLLLGSGIFGVGWGMSGICPGPGIILLSSGALRAFAFVGGLLAGAFAATVVSRN
jgi:uncharacterized protein